MSFPPGPSDFHFMATHQAAAVDAAGVLFYARVTSTAEIEIGCSEIAGALPSMSVNTAMRFAWAIILTAHNADMTKAQCNRQRSCLSVLEQPNPLFKELEGEPDDDDTF